MSKLDVSELLERFEALKFRFPLPEQVREKLDLGQASSPFALAAKLAVDLSMVKSNPWLDVTQDAEYRVPGHPAVSRYIAEMGGIIIPDEIAQGDEQVVQVPDAWGLPVYPATVDQIREVLELTGAEQVRPGVYTFIGDVYDTNLLAINGKPVTGMMVQGIDGTIEKVGVTTSFYLRLSTAFTAGQAGNFKQKFSGMVALGTVKAQENRGIGYYDPATASAIEGKTALYRITWSEWGFRLIVKESDKSEDFSIAAANDPKLFGDGRGKFMFEAEHYGLEVDEASKEVFSVANATKVFARLKLPLSPQCSLVHGMDVGYLESLLGKEHHGRLVQALYAPAGITAPYLGSLVALTSRKDLGELFAHYVPNIVEDKLPGTRPLTPVVKVGDAVKEGDLLIDGSLLPIVADCSGIVMGMEINPDHNDNSTSYVVEIGEPDLEGEVKARGVVKGSVTYCDHVNPDWDAINMFLGYGAASAGFGDVMVYGLNSSDKPVLYSGQDGLKFLGKNLFLGHSWLAANTLKEKVRYSPKADAKGVYDDLKKRFEKVAKRTFRIVFAVNEDVAVLIQKGLEQGVVPSDVTVNPFTQPDGRQIFLVIQKTWGYLVTDLIKVECLPVKAGLTVGRMTLEPALWAKAKGDKAVAEWIYSGLEESLQELEAVHRSAGTKVVKDQDGNDVVVYGDGTPVTSPVIGLGEANEALRNRFLELAQDPELLKAPITIINRLDRIAATLDPKVLKTFGAGTEEAGFVQRVKHLLACMGNDTPDAAQALRRVRKNLKALAKSEGVNKRANRGVKTVQAKSRAGFIAKGWIAASYYGAFAQRLVTISGIDRKECREWGINPVELLFGHVAAVYRAPQNQLQYVRIYFPDAPKAVWDRMVAEGRVPVGAVRSTEVAGPYTFTMSPEDVAADHGDKDGDGRNVIVPPLNRFDVIEEMLAGIKTQYVFRLNVLNRLQGWQ